MWSSTSDPGQYQQIRPASDQARDSARSFLSSDPVTAEASVTWTTSTQPIATKQPAQKNRARDLSEMFEEGLVRGAERGRAPQPHCRRLDQASVVGVSRCPRVDRISLSRSATAPV